MKLYLHCYKCQEEFAARLKSYGAGEDLAPQITMDALSLHEVEVRDDSVYAVDCYKHGKANVILYTQRFEILFQIGLNAILDGYYRDAVGSFSSSFEKFQEYYLTALATINGLDGKLEEVWKHMAGRAERQLGAYAATYFFFNEELPPLLSQSQIEFRNRVIHQGKIPSQQEATKFGNGIFSVIRPVLAELREKSRQALEKNETKFKEKLQKM